MSLEAKQSLNNALIQSAQFQAARQTLGLSQEEMLAAVSRQQRRQARADQQFDPDQYLRQIAQSEKTTTTNVGRPELDGIKFLDDDELDAGLEEIRANSTNMTVMTGNMMINNVKESKKTC